MKCADIQNHVLDYIDNNLTNDLKEAFESHIKECEHCSLKVMQFKELEDKFSNASSIETSQNFKGEFFNHLEKERNTRRIYNSFKPLMRIAAAILLFAGGALFGGFLQNQVGTTTKLALLEQEVGQLKQQVHMASLMEKTPSEKILAIEYLHSQEINQELLNTLDFLLNNDESANVRIEAAEALYKLGHSKDARDVLIKSLHTGQSPIVQIKLINFLTEIEERRVIEPLEYLIKDHQTNKMVKQYAQSSLQTLI